MLQQLSSAALLDLDGENWVIGVGKKDQSIDPTHPSGGRGSLSGAEAEETRSGHL